MKVKIYVDEDRIAYTKKEVLEYANRVTSADGADLISDFFNTFESDFDQEIYDAIFNDDENSRENARGILKDVMNAFQQDKINEIIDTHFTVTELEI